MTAFQESFGEDSFDDSSPEWWQNPVDTIGYNYKTGLWECTCLVFQDWGKCKHVFRWRGEETVRVREEFL